MLEQELGFEALAQGLDYEHTPQGKTDTALRPWETKLMKALSAHTIGLTELMPPMTKEDAEASGRFWLQGTKEYKGAIV